MGRIILNNEEYTGSRGSAPVSDVTVDGTSVVTNGVAEVVSDNLAPTVTEASSRTNLAVGDSLKTIISKIKKFFSDLKAVAFSGSYNDLSDKPTIPSAQVNSDWNANSGVAQILNKPSLATVATSGKSSDLNNDAGFITSAGSCASAGWSNSANRLHGTDTRSTNEPPSTYMVSNAKGDIVTEFKERSAIGAPGSSQYGTLITITPWSNWSGSRPVQIYVDSTGQRAIRYATADSTWGSWESIALLDDLHKDADGNDIRYKYVNIYNYNNWGQSSSVTLNDLATQGMSMAMIYPATDNPLGRATWVHCISMAWDRPSNSNWISQIAIGVENGYGMWYRTTNGAITGRGWNQIIDSGNIGNQSVYCSSRLARDGNNANPMIFNWNGQGGQPSWIWGGNDGTNMYVYNPRNFYVSRADMLGDIYSSDKNGTNGNGWYSLGVAQIAPSGYTYPPFAINYYWGIDMRTGGPVRINDKDVMHSGGAHLDSTIHLYWGDGTVWIANDGNFWLELKSNNGNRYRAAYHDFRNADNTGWVTISALSFATQSSKRYKENIAPISEEKALKILDVDVVNFDYKKDSGHGEGDERLDKTGVIAEDVVNIIPEVVSYREIDGEQKVDSVDYSKFVPFLIKMVQMQQKEIDELKAIIKGDKS